MLFAYTCAGSRSIVVKESCHRQDGLTKIKIPRGSAACEGRSIVCFVCVLVHFILLKNKVHSFYGYIID